MDMNSRYLSEGETAALSSGLWPALISAGVRPRIIRRASPLAHIARLWRGSVPIMVLGRTIWWPDAPDDVSAPGCEREMAILQHELQHVLEFATGALTIVGYAVRPRNWRYGYTLGRGEAWGAYGAEQRAQIVQDYWLAGRGLLPGGPSAEDFRSLIPWAV